MNQSIADTSKTAPALLASQMRKPKSLAVILGAYTAMCLMLLGSALMVAPMSMTMFDAPGSTTSPLTLALALGVLAGPILFVASPLIGWVAFSTRRYHLSWWTMSSLLIWPAYMALIILLLDTFCGGRFTCRLWG